ncbi:ATP-dependent DNA ligase [Candidatus Micrarchaeota archaeon]|nr:ATP-dependent DNA ligase [Candidatus Micrarchaeota archaeon]
MLLFSEVAEVFQEIEKRSGRLGMTDLIGALLKKADAKEIDKLVYILQGILAPPYEDIDLGVGERFAIEAIASSSGYSKSDVEKSFKKGGDLGDTAEELLGKKKQTALLTTEMEVSYVYEGMLKVSKASGPGSQEHKIKYLTELLNNSSPVEARYIIRLVIGSLRLGVGDPTILDALSVAKVGDRSLRETLERAYNVCADMGAVAKTFYEKDGQKAIEKYTVQTFKPLMPALAERENSPQEIIERLKKCEVEMKYDGFRLQCHKKGDQIQLYSRKLEKMTPMFPDVVEGIRKLKAKEMIFEGEALAFDEKNQRFLPFQQTMQRRRKHGIDAASKEFPLRVFVFDILSLDGKDLTNEPYHKRRKLVQKIFGSKLKNKTKNSKIQKPKHRTTKQKPQNQNILMPSESKLISKTKDLETMIQKSLDHGLEGIIAKDLNAPYTAGKRKFAWIKLKKSYGKSVDTIDGVIVGYYLGQGARAEFEFGGMLVAVYNSENGRLETIAKVASGFTEDEMVKLREMLEKIKTKNPPKTLDSKLETDYWVEPKYVIEVAFDDITQSTIHTCGASSGRTEGKGYALRFPRLVQIREDKGVKDITTTNEVEEMFELQRSM